MHLERFLEAIFPSLCIYCGCSLLEPASGAVCATCLTKVTLNATLFCGSCSARLPFSKKVCHQNAPYVLGAAGEYDDPILRTLVHSLKFRGLRRAATSLGDLVARYASSLGLDLSSYIVVPLPLSRERERIRGFNQSALIARRFAEQLELCVKENILLRIAHRKPQSETSNLEERLENVRGCFAPRAGADAILKENKNVILIDDVTTSGATFREAALTLKSAGARRILAIACARA